MAIPIEIANNREAIIGKPRVVKVTAKAEAASPLTEPTDRSISPTSKIITIPKAITPTAADCIKRLTKFALDKKKGFID